MDDELTTIQHRERESVGEGMTHDELNKLCLEGILGWKRVRDANRHCCFHWRDGDVEGWETPSGDLFTVYDKLPNFCTSIAAAWMLLEKLDWFWFQVGRENCDGVRWDVRTYDDYDCKAEDEINVTCEDTAPLAITKACLKAAGVKV